MKRKRKIPSLPQLLDRKIYKTGQTRGADDDVIYQNRVGRNSTVLIPYSSWANTPQFLPPENKFENGFIICISPKDYFNTAIQGTLSKQGLKLGTNTLVLYETRDQWNNYPPPKAWKPAQSRIAPLRGQYIARVPATTATTDSEKIVKGFTTKLNKGAGIRVFEYASTVTIRQCRDQLEALFWHCYDSEAVVLKNGMSQKGFEERKKINTARCSQQGLLEYNRLIAARILNQDCKTICPLCLLELSGEGFFSRMQQAAGREVPDLTVTEINLFHIEELRMGAYNHHPYNLGWGHHHCNVVTRDKGISETLKWMNDILRKKGNYFESANKGV